MCLTNWIFPIVCIRYPMCSLLRYFHAYQSSEKATQFRLLWIVLLFSRIFFFPFYLIRIFPGRLIRLFVWPTQLNMLGLEWMVLANAQNVNRSTAHVSLLLPCINNKFRNVARYTHICLVFFPFTAVFSLHSRRLNFITTTEHLETC